MEVDLLYEAKIPLWCLSQFPHNNLKIRKPLPSSKTTKWLKQNRKTFPFFERSVVFLFKA